MPCGIKKMLVRQQCLSAYECTDKNSIREILGKKNSKNYKSYSTYIPYSTCICAFDFSVNF